MKDRTGIKYGRLTAIKPNGKSNDGHISWLCKCDCGVERVVRGGYLTSGSVRSCGCLLKENNSNRENPTRLPKGLATMRGLYYKYKNSAKKRGYTFDIDEFQFRHITQERCHYCGVEPSRKRNNSKYNEIYYYNGIDRINNDIGYCIDNCVACCWDCNNMKKAKDYDEFINHIHRIARNINEYID